MDRFVNTGETLYRGRDLDEFWQDDGSLLPDGEEEPPPQLREYPDFRAAITCFKSRPPLETQTAVREYLRQQCEEHKVDLHTLAITVSDNAQLYLTDCGDFLYMDAILTSGSGMLVFLAPGSTMVWLLWPGKPLPLRGPDGLIFPFVQDLVMTRKLKVTSTYYPQTSPHKAVYELANYAISVARAPSERLRAFGVQDYHVVEYSWNDSPRSKALFTPHETQPNLEREPVPEEYYPSDVIEILFAGIGMHERVLMDEPEAYWEQYPSRVHPAVSEGGPVPRWLARGPVTGSFETGRGFGWMRTPEMEAAIEAANRSEEEEVYTHPGVDFGPRIPSTIELPMPVCEHLGQAAGYE
jgi:hypothetical protein